ncbi:DNA repair protein RecO [bacterium]|jgi:DNA repair protein RecO (recombination protein O)|nr:DNA repair protein RecO [bacterium]MBT4121976.1 DNA repair protein RecO [bacterium]MBT4335479.1 DNA repair protein RecO [bacterium]MBT4495205.1 DNA repair protein RecO [bacterium]MBT4764393.1 DNA repair protein RecO [bacterium]
MSTYKTDCLVLAKRVLKDADRVYVLYSRDHGKIEGKVRSGASSKSKLAGHIEPLALSRIMIVKGKSLETIAGTALIKKYEFDLDVLPYAQLASEFVIKLIKPGISDINIFNLIHSYLSSLEKYNNIDIVKIITLRFSWQFLRYLGYSPDLNNKLSKESKELLDACLAKRSDLTKLTSSTKVLVELSNFTKYYLHYIGESDFTTFNICFYGKIS